MSEQYYTNSSQLQVGYTDDLWEMCRLQDNLQTKYTGGCVEHLYLGERIPHEQVKTIIKAIFTKFKMPYISLTPSFSVCPQHGYINGEPETCPTCGGEVENYTRVCGYLRPKKQFNPGKLQETKDRKMYNPDTIKAAP